MTKEGQQALKTIVIVTLLAAILVWLAWLSMADLVFVALAALLGLAVGWRLGTRHAAAQARQARRVRRRTTQPSKTMGEQVMRRPARPTR